MKQFKGIPIGYSQSGKPLYFKRSGHLITVAAPRSGKGRDILVPAALEWPYSILVLDPKAELMCLTAEGRKRFGRVFQLNPYGLYAEYVKGVEVVQVNPMHILQPHSKEFSAQATKLVDGIVRQATAGQEAFFAGGASDLGELILMFVAKYCRPEEINLATVRKIISGDVYSFCREAMKLSDPIIREKAARIAAPRAEDSRSIADIIQTLHVDSHFLSDQALIESLCGSKFRFADMRREVTTIYVVLPLKYLDVQGNYSRLVIANALFDFLSTSTGIPVLMMMDEFFQLGPLKGIVNAMAMAAGLNLTAWPVLQDLNQLCDMYPHTFQSFLSGAAVRMFFSVRDERTANYVSGLCGHTMRQEASKSVSDPEASSAGNGRGPSVNYSFGLRERPLMPPHEVASLEDDEMLLFVDGVRGPIRAKRRAYYHTPEYRGLYGLNPYHTAPRNKRR